MKIKILTVLFSCLLFFLSTFIFTQSWGLPEPNSKYKLTILTNDDPWKLWEEVEKTGVPWTGVFFETHEHYRETETEIHPAHKIMLFGTLSTALIVTMILGIESALRRMVEKPSKREKSNHSG